MRPWRAILPVCESFSNKIPFCGHRNWLCRCGRAAAPAATTQPARTPSPRHHTPSHSCMQHSTPREGGCCGPVGLIKSRFTLILIHAKPFLPFVFSLIYAANTHRAGRERGDQGERLKSVLKLKSAAAWALHWALPACRATQILPRVISRNDAQWAHPARGIGQRGERSVARRRGHGQSSIRYVYVLYIGVGDRG